MLFLALFNLQMPVITFVEKPVVNEMPVITDIVAPVVVAEKFPSNIDMNKIRDTWLGWNNETRKLLGLSEYSINSELNISATVWSETSKLRGYMDHKREGQTEYYDFYKIRDWFKDVVGIEFENDLFTENIAWGVYDCDSADPDCTQYLIDKIRYSYDFFIAEKGEDYSPHYDSIVNKYFKIIGLGIAIDEKAHKYYLTVHYAGALKTVVQATAD